MALLRRDKKGRSDDAQQLAGHFEELRAVREERLRELGVAAFEMHRDGNFDEDALRERVTELEEIDAEAALVSRGIDEGLTLSELSELPKP